MLTPLDCSALYFREQYTYNYSQDIHMFPYSAGTEKGLTLNLPLIHTDSQPESHTCPCPTRPPLPAFKFFSLSRLRRLFSLRIRCHSVVRSLCWCQFLDRFCSCSPRFRCPSKSVAAKTYLIGLIACVSCDEAVSLFPCERTRWSTRIDRSS